MKASQIFSALLVATCASAGSDWHILINYNDILVPLSSVKSPDHTLLVHKEPGAPDAPTFDFRNGIVATDYSNGQEVIGVVDNELVYGKISKVKPLKFQVDSTYKVTNLRPYVCRYEQEVFRGFLLLTNPKIENLRCAKVNLYLMPTDEIEKHIPHAKQ